MLFLVGGNCLIKKILLIVFTIIIITFGVLITPTAISVSENLNVPEAQEAIVTYLNSFGVAGIPVLILLQAFQIVIAFLPGGIVEVASGMMYGWLIGTIISLSGTVIGTFIAFLLVRKYGRPFVLKVVSKQAYSKYANICTDKRFEMLTIFLFFLPGIPKDVLIYIIGAGNSDKRIWVMATIARIPSVVVSVYAGNLFGQGDFTTSIIVYTIFLLVGIIGFLIHNVIIKKMEGSE